MASLVLDRAVTLSRLRTASAVAPAGPYRFQCLYRFQ
jgi:hypothetical protein